MAYYMPTMKIAVFRFNRSAVLNYNLKPSSYAIFATGCNFSSACVAAICSEIMFIFAWF